MKITSKDYGVLFKLLIKNRTSEIVLKEEVAPGKFFTWPDFSCWCWPKLTKAEMDVEIHRIYDSEDYHEFGDLCGIAMKVYEERAHSSYWCGPVSAAKTRKEFEKECRKRKVIFEIDEDLYNLFCEPKKHTKGYNPNINLRKKS